MAETKTKPTEVSVDAFLAGIDARRRHEANAVMMVMQRVTGEPPVMWGPSIIGFGRYRYRYESGREGEMARVSFSPRKPQLVFYGLISSPGAEERLARLGKHSTGKGCLYVKRLADVDLGVLEELVRGGYETRKQDEV
jgi:hypothetical protein